MSIEAEASGNYAKALKLSKRASKEEPGFVPAQVRLAHLLMSSGKQDKAIKVLEDAWAVSPNPEIAHAYWPLTDARNALSRMKAAHKLAVFNPTSPTTKLMLVQNALDAGLWSDARKNLEEIRTSDEPVTRNYCQLMAQLEEAENSDMIAAREWLVRAASANADPSWVCQNCGNVADAWSALCGACYGFDKLQWRCPSRVPGLGMPKEYDPEASSLARPNEVVLQDIDANSTEK
jgi:HemY protein